MTALRALLLLTVVLASGCLAAGPSQGTEEEPLRKRIGVVLYNEDFQAAPYVPVEATVSVPAGASNVRLELTAYANSLGSVTATVGLQGCGFADIRFDGWAEAFVTKDGWLCEQSHPGPRQLTILTNGAPMAGRLLLRADLP